ncbi:GNAT family N-acetyltransferase [Leptolyngbya sp. 'hensonii']|uniref:GNAT family N-acetyltransferase n=1 Tax=Leptolyngbya sp. 'hensonii' TaxID=1922337 RepID=UPI000950104C|nr:GNAT family N-acetyltransferase [Leptolyngbya sp. 'hensonii']OLP16385.1 GNAT family N-acetyltransferase [Leptolyngbya sp. 'hensonii']
MPPAAPEQQSNTIIRSVQRQDLEQIEQLFREATADDNHSRLADIGRQLRQIRRWYGPLKFLSFFPSPLQNLFSAYVAEQDNQLQGAIQVSPFNRTRTTWRVDCVAVDSRADSLKVGSQLLRYCFEAIWEARTWILEVDVNHKSALALYRHTGFQHLAQITYWSLPPALLQELAERQPDLPNLLPVGNADAQLLHQLDTASMPPLVRQVFDRHIYDFKTNLLQASVAGISQRLEHKDVMSGYVFEPQRKAAIGYYEVQLNHDGSQPHTAQLTVHPAYTWLYPELVCQMARVASAFPFQPLRFTSADYQSEREEYLEHIGAERVAHTLMMSRSVWHKLRETRPISLEGLQLSEVLQGLQRIQKPIPSRLSSLPSFLHQQGHANKLPPHRFPRQPEAHPLENGKPEDTP